MRRGVVAFLLVVSGCASGEKPGAGARDTLTQRQRDSVIGASRLPGAQGIQKAQAAQDSAAARNAQADSIQ